MVWTVAAECNVCEERAFLNTDLDKHSVWRHVRAMSDQILSSVTYVVQGHSVGMVKEDT